MAGNEGLGRRQEDSAAVRDPLREAAQSRLPVLVVAPPGGGKTAFLRMLGEDLATEGHRSVVVSLGALTSASRRPPGSAVLLIDDDTPPDWEAARQQAAMDRVAALLKEPSVAGVVIAGVSRVVSAAAGSFPGAPVRRLSRLDDEETAHRLVVEPLSRELHADVSPATAQQVCSELGGHPRMIKRLVATAKELGSDRSPASVVGALLESAPTLFADYFGRLAEEVVFDDKAAYALAQLTLGTLAEPNPVLADLWITAPDGLSFCSPTFQTAIARNCPADKLASLLQARGRWLQAAQLYDLHLTRTDMAPEDRVKVMRQGANAAIQANDFELYLSFAKGLYLSFPNARSRNGWLSSEFIPNVGELLERVRAAETSRIPVYFLRAVDLITRTGRARLYAIDPGGNKLNALEVLDSSAAPNEAARQPIDVDGTPSKAAAVFKSGEFDDVPDPEADQDASHWLARQIHLRSCWLFPVAYPPGFSHESQWERLGVLCVDDPYQASSRPGESEQEQVKALLTAAAPSLVRAKTRADRLRLETLVSALTSLHGHIFADHPAEEVLNDLFRVARTIRPNISLITVRLVGGRENKRLKVAGFWPPQAKKVLLGPTLRSIDIEDSVTTPDAPQSYQVLPELTDRSRMSPALVQCLDLIEEENLGIAIGGLITFNLATQDKYVGVCSFYTAIPGGFDESEIAALQLAVTESSVAIFNARQVEQMRRLRQSMEILSTAVAMVGSETKTPALVEYLLSELGKFPNCRSVSFLTATPTEDGSDYLIELRDTWPRPDADVGTVTPNMLSTSVTAQAIRTCHYYVLSSSDQEWGSRYKELVPGIKTCAAFPMLGTGPDPIGAITFESEEEDAFSSDDLALLDTIVQQVPICINNLSLVENLGTEKALLKTANDMLERQQWAAAVGGSVAVTIHRIVNKVGLVPSSCRKVARYIRGVEPGMSSDEAIGQLEQAAKAAEDLKTVANLLKESAKKPREVASVRPRDLLLEVWRNLHADDVDLDYSGLGDGITLITARDKYIAVLECLLDNAVRASRNGHVATGRQPTVTVSAKRLAFDDRDHVELRVRDSGQGVERSIADKVCKAVVRSNWDDGNGFGLFASSLAAVALGGSLELADNSESNGAEFCLRVPAHLEIASGGESA